jgi:hypothetical protein
MRALADAFQETKEDFEQSILDEMGRVANAMNLDKMMFLHFGNTYERAGREVQSKRLEELDNLYCDMIHHCGFEAIWTKEKGWC